VQYPTPQNARTSPLRNRSLGCAGLSANVRTKGQVHRAPRPLSTQYRWTVRER
jgi:hypothetical protein